MAMRLQSRSQSLLCVAIGWCNIKVVDASVHRLSNDVAGERWAVVHYNNPGETYDGKVFARPAQRPSRNRLGILDLFPLC
jgi:hypothetical protein